MTDYLTHVTTEGERFDLLAYRYYGNPYAYQLIAEANIAQIGLPPVFGGGVTLKIPVIQQPSASPANLPPWKR